ncbi:hypothetical protein GF337_19550, partial [candidate division KSB1 bacterium]|nr:hypothetical protein [candidate division KSB1 bacterium]
MKLQLIVIGLLIILLLSTSASGQSFSNEDCMMCHEDEELTMLVDDSVEVSIYVDIEKFSNSLHGGFECMDCHSNIEDLPHAEDLEHPDCNMCHEDAAEIYAGSIHGRTLEQGMKEAPYCWDCHTSHYVYPSDDSLSSVFILNQPQTCGECHSDQDLVEKFNIPISHPSEAYETSVHYQEAVQGNLNSASCSDCHGVHDLEPQINPDSKINIFNIPQT